MAKRVAQDRRISWSESGRLTVRLIVLSKKMAATPLGLTGMFTTRLRPTLKGDVIWKKFRGWH